MSDYTVDINDLESLLTSLANNTPTTPYDVCVNGLSEELLYARPYTLNNILRRNNKYVIIDFGIPISTITSLSHTFFNCKMLIGVKNIPSSVTVMDHCFEGCTSLNQPITIPDSVASMYSCFEGCTSLNQPITIPDSVASMYSCFEGCTSLNQPITIPDYVTDIGHCFEGCTSFNQPITIPDYVTDIGHCFEGCTSFNQPITIPDSVSYMSHCFYGCTSFNQPITIRNSVKSIECCFYNCTSLNQPITIPDSVFNMISCFEGCTSFNQPITIPDSVSYMSRCFYGCTSFNQPITIPDSVTNMYALFSHCSALNKHIYIDCRGLGNDELTYTYMFVNTFELEEVTLRFNSYGILQKFLSQPQTKDSEEGGSGLSTVNIILPKNGIQSDYHGYHLKHINDNLSIDIYNKQGELVRNTTIPYSQNLTIVGKTNELVFGEEIPSEKIVQAIDARTPFSKTGTSGKYDITKKNFILWGADPNAFLTNLNFDTTVRDFIVPVGFIYTQYPLELPPWQLWTFTTQSNWENISNHFAGLFSRIEGGNSEQFEKILPCSTNGTTLTFETTTHGITNFSLLIDTTTWECRQVTAVNGASVTIAEAFTDSVNLRNVLIGEREQLPNARGTFNSNNYQIQNTAGVFSSDSGGPSWGQGSGNSGPWNTKRFSLSKGQVITTNPNTYKTEAQSVFKDNGYVRPSNMTVRIWKRIN